ncbi:MAG: hypothetical protein VX836_04660 [Pseudomonadota bacterium]|nr:hypothetical protein [Pseudomonadota bacterium]
MHPIKSNLQPVVEQRIGRNLLRYQLVELRLKALLPLRKIDFSDEGISDFKERSARVQTQTLGQLIAGLLDSVEGAPSPDRAQRIDEFLRARNWLAHHLLASHGALQSDTDCTACIERLDLDYAAAEIVAAEVMMATRITFKMIRAFVEAWEQAGANLSEGTQLMAAIERHLGDETPMKIEITMPPDSVENILAVVMRRLHHERHDPEGWTHFAVAGQVARRESPDLPKKGLLDIARKLEGFQFGQRPAGAPNAAWMFRPTS